MDKGNTHLEHSFEEIYSKYFLRLKRFAKEYVISEEEAENIVQNVFISLWQRADTGAFPDHLQAWLYESVKNGCLNFLRHASVMKDSENKLSLEYESLMKLNLQALEELNDEYLQMENLEELLSDAIDTLSPRCREIFVKCKIEGGRQQDVAKEHGISVNTVETQIGIAYRKLREFFDKH